MYESLNDFYLFLKKERNFSNNTIKSYITDLNKFKKFLNDDNYDINKITNDLSKSDGCLQKTVDNSYFKQIYPNFKFVSLDEGLKRFFKWTDANYSDT